LEIWKDIPEYEGIYQISNFGRLRSVTRTVIDSRTKAAYTVYGRIMKERYMPNGYIQACLCKDSKYRYFYIHRLVSEAFLENPNNLPQVNHIDCNKSNNSVDNLEWCTGKENGEHGSKNLLYKHGESHHMTKLSESQVREIKRLLKEGNITQINIAKMFSTNRTTIYNIKNEHTWKHVKI
jgi:DNA-binding XRE family transcriptional regulator